MKKIMMGIAIILFAILLTLCTSGMGMISLVFGFGGLILSIFGFGDECDRK